MYSVRSSNGSQSLPRIVKFYRLLFHVAVISLFGKDAVTGNMTFSCANRCGATASYTNCGCDVSCKKYGDCCVDIALYCNSVVAATNYTSLRNVEDLFHTSLEGYYPYTSCISLPKLSLYPYPSSYLMVTRCPTLWNPDNDSDGMVRAFCESESGSESDVLSLIPMQNNLGIVYRNLFCAFCHNVDMEDLIPWKVVTKKEVPNSIEIQAPRSPWSVSPELLCPDNHTFVASCRGGHHLDASDYCHLHLDSRYLAHTKHIQYFKNYYCATCNDVNMTKLIRMDILSIATNVIFGFGSFPTFVAKCELRNHPHHTQGNIFQNACRMYETVFLYSNDESCRPEDCISKFINDSLHGLDEERIPHFVQKRSCDSLEVSLYLTTKLSFHLLQTTINKGLVVIQCRARFELFLSTNASQDPECLIGNSNDTMESYNDYFRVAVVECNQSCMVIASESALETCIYESPQDMECSYKEENLTFDNFKVKHIHSEVLFYPETGVELDSSMFAVQEEGRILSCFEHIHRPLLQILQIIHVVCFSLSMLGVVTIIGLHVIFKKLQTLYGFCLVNLCLAIALTIILHFVNLATVQAPGVQTTTVVISHFSMLSIFSWQMVIAIHVARTFGQNTVANRMSRISTRSVTLKYFLSGWATPIPFVTAGVIMHACNCTGFLYLRKFMSEGPLTVIVFTLPVNVLSVTSAISFLIALRNMKKMEESSTSQHHHGVENVSVALRLGVTTGLPWIVLNLVILVRDFVFLLIVLVLLSLHGVFLFAAFASTKTVRRLCAEKISSLYRSDNQGQTHQDHLS